MIKILYTIPNFDTAGSGKALLNLACGLDKNRFEVHIACKTNQGKFFETVTNSKVPVHVFDYEAPMRPIKSLFKQGWKISRELKKINPDIIHSFHYSNNYGEPIAAWLAGAKWIFTKKNMNWGSDGANAWKIRSALAKKIIVQNQAMSSRFFPKSKKTVLIERGINTQAFNPIEPEVTRRDQMATPKKGRIIIAVANMQPVKGLEYLIDAFLELESDFPDWHLWLVGDDATTYGLELHKKVARLNKQDKIHFSGKQIDVVPYLQHAEIFVMPTTAVGEGSPVALIEAMVNAKVVFGSAVPGVIDQLKHVPKHLFIPENTEALVEALRPFLRNDVITNRTIGQSFRKYALGKYTIEREVKEHEQVYESIVMCGNAE